MSKMREVGRQKKRLKGGRLGGRLDGREVGRQEGGRMKGRWWEGRRKIGRMEDREGGREGGREIDREGGRYGGMCTLLSPSPSYSILIRFLLNVSDYLLTNPLDPNEDHLPSPESLIYKIIIKVNGQSPFNTRHFFIPSYSYKMNCFLCLYVLV